MRYNASAMVKTAVQRRHKLPVHITTYLSWKELLHLLEDYQDKIIIHVPSEAIKKEFVPEEETVLLKSAGFYTEAFIKQNEHVKKSIKRKGVTCNSIEELRESLTK